MDPEREVPIAAPYLVVESRKTHNGAELKPAVLALPTLASVIAPKLGTASPAESTHWHQ